MVIKFWKKAHLFEKNRVSVEKTMIFGTNATFFIIQKLLQTYILLRKKERNKMIHWFKLRTILYLFLMHLHHLMSALILYWDRTQKCFVYLVICVEKNVWRRKNIRLHKTWDQLQIRTKIGEKRRKLTCSIYFL